MRLKASKKKRGHLFRLLAFYAFKREIACLLV